jgi:hypothetical protein
MITGNEPAFAASESGTEQITTWEGQKGLTIRQHFAAMAMQGILAGKIDKMPKGLLQNPLPFAEGIISSAIFFADELIEQLNKPT